MTRRGLGLDFFWKRWSMARLRMAGLPLGLDRIVMILAGAESLREVIPFPKTARAVDFDGGCAYTGGGKAVAGVGNRGEEVAGAAL